jgi:hypothetical protein
MSHIVDSKACLLASTLLGLSACDVSPLEDETGGGDIPQSVQDAFENNCTSSGCHAGGSPAAGLSLEPAQLAAIVGGSTTSSELPLVEIGDLDGSYLALKMLPASARPESAGPVVGGQMPPGQGDQTELAIILAWIAGADVDEATGSGGEDTGGEAPCFGPMETPTSVTFADHIYPIVQNRCSLPGCHDSEASNGLAFPDDDPELARLAIVGVNSTAGMPFVTADSPDNSYLWHKVSGTYLDVDGGQGALMPIGGGMLCTPDLLHINKWILQGAN